MLSENHRRELVRCYGLGWQKGMGWPTVDDALRREIEGMANDALATLGVYAERTIMAEDLFFAC